MRVVIDIEANALENPTKIWVIVCKDIDKGDYHIFRKVTDDALEREAFSTFAKTVKLWIGHNIIGYDLPVLRELLGVDIDVGLVVDTLVVSKLINYSRDSHSIEDYGEQFGCSKIKFTDFSKYSLEMENYCVRDVDICHRIFDAFTWCSNDRRWDVTDSRWKRALGCEQRFQTVVNDLHNNGFGFDSIKAGKLLDKVSAELGDLDKEILEVFPPKLTLIREVHPEVTKHGTLNKKDFRWVSDGNLSEFNGGPFCRCSLQPFNPSSHKQIIDILYRAGWKPTERTKTHIELGRESTRRDRNPNVDYDEKLRHLAKYGWKVNETNLSTLPDRAPKPARTIARRILLEARRRTLTEWGALARENGRIHGDYYGIGAWTQRMAHQNPNTANIPNDTDTQGKVKLLGAEMRSLWIAPKGKLLVGVDAESIQLRIFAHYIDDPVFTKSIVEGRKDEGTDPHSLNKKILGSVCKSRDAAKRFIYALLLGAGMSKLGEVLSASPEETRQALDRLLEGYAGFAKLKRTTIPRDSKRGFFIGLDGRSVRIKGDSQSERNHLAMSGYLQNGEAVIMKHATLLWYERLKSLGIEFKLVDMVHDEWQTECHNDLGIALAIADEQCKALEEIGRRLKLRCPLKGSYGEFPKYTIGSNWKVTH